MPQYDFTAEIAEYTALAEALASGKMDAKQRKNAERALQAKIREYSNKYYCFYVWYVNNGAWIPGRLHTFLCQTIQEFVEAETGHAYDILLLRTAPQHGKSKSVTEALPSWFMGRWPNKKEVLISYNEETSLRFAKANKEKTEAFGRQLFDVEIDKEYMNRADEFRLKGSDGYMISRGLSGGITSYGAHLMLLDDPVKSSSQADSELNRVRLNTDWNMTFKSRLAPGAKIVVIMTPWHELDIGGYIMENEPPECLRVVTIPCEAEEDDPLGRFPGMPLAPEIGRDGKWIAQFKRGFVSQEGTRAWNAMYQCRPASIEGNMFKRHFWKYWQPKGAHLPPVRVYMPDGTTELREAEEFPDFIDERLQSWDCTFKDTKNTDRVSGGHWERHGADIYLTDKVKDRMDIVRTMREIENMTARHPKTLAKLIEGKANGPAVIQMLRHKIGGLIDVEPYGGKESRAHAILPTVEAGNVYLPHPAIASWVPDYIEEMAAFPNGRFDDDVDMTSQALRRLTGKEKSHDPALKPLPDYSLEGREKRRIERITKDYEFGKREERA